MDKHFKLNLQLFGGEGAGSAGSAGEGGGEGATTGDNNATAAAEQRLRELGVPEDKIRKRASKVASRAPVQTAPTAETAPAEATNVDSAATQSEPTTEESQDNNVPTKRMTWEEIMKDPEYNKNMQAVVRSRLKSEKSAEETLNKITPALELLARQYSLDPNNIDYEALNNAIDRDRAYYEEKALEMGTSIETAMQMDRAQRAAAREKKAEDDRKAEEAMTLREIAFRDHYARLERQGEELKKFFPNFDLQKELKNPVFARMTAPGKGLMSVEDAYRAVHRQEIEAASSQIIAYKTAEKLSNAIQSGSKRPNESGASSQAPSVSTFDYAKASREQREAFKKDIRARMARGEKVYPGQR
jgi:hypothetical protein